METAILRAHYDGEHIILDEPFELIANDFLMVRLLLPTLNTPSGLRLAFRVLRGHIATTSQNTRLRISSHNDRGRCCTHVLAAG